MPTPWVGTNWGLSTSPWKVTEAVSSMWRVLADQLSLSEEGATPCETYQGVGPTKQVSFWERRSLTKFPTTSEWLITLHRPLDRQSFFYFCVFSERQSRTCSWIIIELLLARPVETSSPLKPWRYAELSPLDSSGILSQSAKSTCRYQTWKTWIRRTSCTTCWESSTKILKKSLSTPLRPGSMGIRMTG